jgi:microcystin-dependent protein
MPIAQNTALFSLIGTYYGGDGKSNFGLPNLQARSPLQQGQVSGLSSYVLGQSGGATTITLQQNNLPIHNHAINCVDGPRVGGQLGDPTNSILVKTSGSPANAFNSGGAQNQQLPQNTLAPVGGSQPHNNLMPYLTLNFCIALQGVFPARS